MSVQPCPFCNTGSPAVCDAKHNGHTIYHYVKCRECGAQGACKKTPQAAVAAWNERTGGADAPAAPEWLALVLEELKRAVAKHPTWPTDPLHAVVIVGEECGELQKAVLQCTYEPSKSSLADVRKEAVQCLTVAARFVVSLPDYHFSPSEQHKQGGAA